jgi:hypothetical protein
MSSMISRMGAVMFRTSPLLVLTLAVVGGLSSCGHRLAVTPEKAKTIAPGEGFILATTSNRGITRAGEKTPGRGFSDVIIQGTGPRKGEQARFALWAAPGNEEAPISRHGFPSDLQVIPVPSGSYEITGWSVMEHAPGGLVSFRNRLPMKVPFEVKAGEATYIGRANTLTIYGKNLFGMTVPGEAIILVTDEYAKDVPKITKYFPSISRSSIRHSDVPAQYKREMKRIAETPEKFLGLF